MILEEKVREIMLSEELPDSEKLDRLHALIPAETFKIDSLRTATPAQVRLFERWLNGYRCDAKDQVCRFLGKRMGALAFGLSTAEDHSG
jgi:hypothetical protein